MRLRVEHADIATLAVDVECVHHLDLLSARVLLTFDVGILGHIALSPS